MTFDYLENVPNIAATVCDKEGIILYQNKRAIDRDGDVVGKNRLYRFSPWIAHTKIVSQISSCNGTLFKKIV